MFEVQVKKNKVSTTIDQKQEMSPKFQNPESNNNETTQTEITIKDLPIDLKQSINPTTNKFHSQTHTTPSTFFHQP
jgi:hypothetical protein